MTVTTFPGHADAMALPGHAGRCWPLPRWRSVARIATGRWRLLACIDDMVEQ